MNKCQQKLQYRLQNGGTLSRFTFNNGKKIQKEVRIMLISVFRFECTWWGEALAEPARQRHATSVAKKQQDPGVARGNKIFLVEA